MNIRFTNDVTAEVHYDDESTGEVVFFKGRSYAVLDVVGGKVFPRSIVTLADGGWFITDNSNFEVIDTTRTT